MLDVIDINSMPFVEKLDKDLKDSTKLLSDKEVRYLVDAYYSIQEHRIAMLAQARAAMKEGGEEAEPCLLVRWLGNNMEMLESQVKLALQKYVQSQKTGSWLMSITGIGPVLAAGMLTYGNPTGYKTVSGLWRFAGQDPTCKWEKGQKRPWNANLKVLCWKIGESFVKVSNNEKDFYGKLYKEKKELYTKLNEEGKYKDTALEKANKVGKTTEAYKSYSIGKLPPAHIHARAKRFAVKIFLSHFAQVAYKNHYGKDIPNPWIFAIAGHIDKIEPPNLN